VPIAILDVPDPFTPASRENRERPPLIESDAYRQLLHELRRYCRGELAGRSFLVAGHRGAGKTTLVSSVFEALLRGPTPDDDDRSPSRSSWDSNRPMLRPLPVLLQGPTLLPSSREDLPLAADGTGDNDRRLTEMENVLVQITLGLHRALARQMVLAFREHVDRRAPYPIAGRSDMRELAAQLQLELDDYTGNAHLRDIWRRCGALHFGVLYALSPSPYLLHDRIRFSSRLPHTFPDPRFSFQWDQGLRELVALASVCDAYRRISGKISRKDELKAGKTTKIDRSVDLDAKGKDLIAPVVALVTGAAVGAGALAAGQDARVAALAGVLTALAGAVVGKVSINRSRSRATTLEDLFIPDLSVATLDRILPVLLDRLRDAGLAPVFVVDELDKVEGLSERILDMIRRLKKLVAESACFCFLTDRSYFEEMRRRTALMPYSIEHTYFTHQLFISFRHTDVREYLQQILLKPADPPAGTDRKAAAQIREEQADHAVLPFILMHDAQMHPIDLQRQLTQWRDARGDLSLMPGLVRSKRRYLLELLVQLAVEMQLEQGAMQEELDRRPAFRRLAHDAMYFISRRWEQDDETLALTDAAKATFERYLIERMALETKTPPAQPSPSASKPVGASGPVAAIAVSVPVAEAADTTRKTENAGEAPLVNSEDLSFLWTAVIALAQSLASPLAVQIEYEKRGTNEVVLSALREAVKLGPLFEPTDKNVYRWRFRRSGRPVAIEPQPVQPASISAVAAKAQGAVPPPTPPTNLQQQVLTIREFEASLRDVTKKSVDPSVLSAGLGILPTSPAWPQVAAALTRLDTLSATKTAYPEMEDDHAVVAAYAGVVEANACAVALSLYCAEVLAAWSNVSLQHALETVSLVLALHEASPDRVVDELLRIREEMLALKPTTVGHKTPQEAQLPDRQAPAAKWVGWMSALVHGLTIADAAPPVNNDKTEALAWEYWRLRLTGSKPSAASEVLRMAAMGVGPFTVLKVPLETMTTRDWSSAFFQAVSTTRSTPPEWLAFAAMQALGWGERLERFASLANEKKLFANQGAAPAPGDIAALATVLRQPRATGLVVISSQPGALSEKWKPDSNYGTLVLRGDEWALLRSIWMEQRAAVLEAFGPSQVVVDMSATAPARKGRRGPEGGLPWEEPRQFMEFFDRPDRPATAIPLILSEHPTATLPPRYVVVLRPKTIGEVLQLKAPPAM
jgi:hypothetical protein